MNCLRTVPPIYRDLVQSHGKQTYVPDNPSLTVYSPVCQVLGNRIGDEYRAGLVYIAQQSIQTLDGFITSISTNGHFTLTGSFAAGNAGSIDCVLNDPTGRYGPAFTGHELWTVDPDN